MVCALVQALALRAAAPPGALSDSARAQIAALQEEKASLTPARRKLDSKLVFAVKQSRGEAIAKNAVPKLRTALKLDARNCVAVDISGTVTPGLLSLIKSGGGSVISSVPRFNAVRAAVRVSQLEQLASTPGVRFIRRAVPHLTRTGSVNSEGDTTHAAKASRMMYPIDGSGVKVGVLSDSVDSLAYSQSLGDLGPVTVLPGQSGVPGSGEGTAMLEIVHDLAPGAELYYATANNGEASFAQNILALRAAGCDIIVDDVGYFDESPFQDGIIAQAVNTVTEGGALYFSAAGNEGSLDRNTSGTWEGDFVDGGAVQPPLTDADARVHSFGSFTYDTVTDEGFATVLLWSDPLGQSYNDYDLYVLDSTGQDVVDSSTDFQGGFEDPFEMVDPPLIGDRLVVVKSSGEARFLHIDTIRGRLSVGTAGNITGHAATANAFAVAAVDVHTSYPGAFAGGAVNPVEYYSTDGPRRVFYDPDGNPYTPGDVSSTGGILRQKPDIAAADGVVTTLPSNSGLNPFYGTSAAAPHAAAIAALVKSANSSLTTAQIRNILTNSALDIMAAGIDRDSGAGIVMANRALQATPIEPLRITPGAGFIARDVYDPISTLLTLTNIGTTPVEWQIANTNYWLEASIDHGILTNAGPAVSVTVRLSSSAANLTKGIYVGNVAIIDTTTGVSQLRRFAVLVGQPNDYFTELFDTSNFDLANSSVTFTPDGGDNFYSACRSLGMTGFPVDPAGGNQVSLTDDSFASVTLSGTNSVSIHGHRSSVFYIGSNGYITFDTGDREYIESLDQHFTLPRISALYHDLNPSSGGTISWKELPDRVAVTYQGVPEYGTNSPNNFQVEMFFDGTIRITYLAIDVLHALVGLSEGNGTPFAFQPSDLSANQPCGGQFPVFIKQPASQSVVAGENIQFNVDVFGSEPLEFQWRYAGTSLPGEVSPSLQLHSVTTNQAGLYSVVVSNAFGTAVSSNALLSILSGRVVNATTAGWYDSQGNHDPMNDNYIAGATSYGYAFAAPPFRDFFVFDLSPVSDTISNATLRLYTYDVVTALPFETFTIQDVTTPLASLLTNNYWQTNIYDDLGDGTNYGAHDFTTNEQANYVNIPLNAEAIQALNAARGGMFTFGGQLSTLTPGTNDDEYVFGLSSPSNGAVQLVLNTPVFVPHVAYVRAAQVPWSGNSNEAAMNRVFGASNWMDLRYETAAASNLFSPPMTFVYLEGSDLNATALQSFIATNLTIIQSWVSNGGRMFINAAPNQGSGMSLGFGISLVYDPPATLVSTGYTANAAHPVFKTPFVPAGTNWSGDSFAHAYVTGANLIPVIIEPTNNYFLLAEKPVSSGHVMFGGMTLDSFHSPQPQAANLRANIISYASSGSNYLVAPAIQTQPASRAAVIGTDASFSVSASGSAPLSYQWRFEGSPIAGANEPTLNFSVVTANQAGAYSVVVSNALGAATSSNALLSIVSSDESIAVFDNPFFVDTSSGGQSAESDNLQASLAYLGIAAFPVTDLDQAFATYKRLVIPELELADLNAYLSLISKASLSNFVAQGNLLIVHGDGTGYVSALLNSVFGFHITQSAQNAGGTTYSRTAAAMATDFAANQSSVIGNDGTATFYVNTLPAGAISIYETFGLSAVTLFRVHNGVIVYLGWDWYKAYPIGAADNGWLQVLRTATSIKIYAPPPSLSLSRYGSFLLIHWPVNYPNYVLESSTGVTGSPAWTAVPGVPAQIDDNFVVPVLITGQQQFFRLHSTAP